MKIQSLLFFILVFTFGSFLTGKAQSIVIKIKGLDQPDSVSIIYSDTSNTNEIGRMEYYFRYEVRQDTTKRPYKIGFYKDGTDTAFYFDGMKIGYRVDLNRGDEIHPRWLSLGTFPRGYTFGASYHYYQKKHSYYEAYAGIFGMLYPNNLKILSIGANYTRFFCKKEKPMVLYQSALPLDHKRAALSTPFHYQTRIDIVKNIHWGFQTGFTFDQVDAERASTYFNSGNQSFQLMNARSLGAIAGLTRFVSKNMQLSFGKKRDRVLRGANFRRLSFVMAYYPLLEMESVFFSALEGITPDPNADPRDDFYGKPIGWKVIWDGRLAFWGRKNFGIVYRYGIEQTPFRQLGRNGLIPIAAGGIFFNLGKNLSVKGDDWRK